ncbi:cytochrome c maturation protein CcmE [Chelatococcus reniformis]|uniref:Cytochrome c-type biogenesis protein CcmE n=1 Tax=Chelatococcus reniformis TaxID=1494448 RepID=A0A916UIM6_9HYPH|nr:cytochrome c maturation protein CcmE [Chelatococcus reniformis]GGC73576.1 cytochrome c-type biogenesis protein CcmE [Chelatococcus reniformis]
MTRKQRRLALIGSALGVLAVAVGLVLFAMRDTIVFFYGPTEIAQKGIGPGARVRIGGLVKPGSMVREAGQTVQFAITDTATDVAVTYTGLLPDLFREGQGVIAEGTLQPDGSFRAASVLAKHDERYMPREVAAALKKQGVWQGEQPAAASDAKAVTQ